MSFEQLFGLRDEILNLIGSRDLQEDLKREILKILAPFDDSNTVSRKRDVIELICSIEMTKIRFLLGELRAKDLHREVSFNLNQFRVRHQHFNYQDDPIFKVYF
ncbi:MAG TPA: hypothetical protein VFG28_04370 [Syntrophales bacterium]|nr:hypothetical protein [Syntrophales bacterium]